MSRRTWFAGLALAAGCATPPHDVPREGNPAALLQADRDFGDESASRRLEGWVAWFAPDGVQADPNTGFTVGPDAIRQLMAPAFADPTFRLEREPLDAHVSPRGDLGQTWGRYKSRRRTPVGVIQNDGHYSTVWRRDAAGRWRVVYDTGTPD
jgi:ketosteroid isomerase-like protein